MTGVQTCALPIYASFRETLNEILGHFGEEMCGDILSDAQVAFLALQKDPTFRDHGAERYVSLLDGLESGYRALVEIVKESPNG